MFSVATGEKALLSPVEDLCAIGHAVATCLARAIARGVYLAESQCHDSVPCYSAWSKNLQSY